MFQHFPAIAASLSNHSVIHSNFGSVYVSGLFGVLHGSGSQVVHKDSCGLGFSVHCFRAWGFRLLGGFRLSRKFSGPLFGLF